MKSEQEIKKPKSFVSYKSIKAVPSQDKNISKSITTVVKIRNLNKNPETKENNAPYDEENQPVVHVTSENELNVIFEQKELNNNIYPEKFVTYKFDKVIDSSKTQWQTYNFQSFNDFLKNTFVGASLFVICFGGRKSGKTYTIFGDNKGPGLQGNTFKEIFELTEKKDNINAQIRMSYLELYSSEVKDLLADHDELLDTNTIDIREDPKMGVVISGVQKPLVKSLREVKELVKLGNTNKRKCCGVHSIVLISIITPEKIAPTPFNSGKPDNSLGKFSVGRICFADIASRIDQKAKGKQEILKQNRSILALSSCIEALSKISCTTSESSDPSKVTVPFRDSKLTRLLKDSLTGNCKSIFIGNISSKKSDIDETLNTLRYLQKASLIKACEYKIPTVKISNIQKVQNYESFNSVETKKKETEELKICLLKQNTKSVKKLEDAENVQTNINVLKKDIISHFTSEKELLEEISYYKHIKVYSEEKSEGNLINLYMNESKVTTKNNIEKFIKEANEKYSTLKQINRHKLFKSVQDLNQGSYVQNYQINLYQQKMYEVENYEKTINVDKKEESLKNVSKELDFLKDQIKLRDTIVKEQNNIINDVMNGDVLVNGSVNNINNKYRNVIEKLNTQKQSTHSNQVRANKTLPKIKPRTNEGDIKKSTERLDRTPKMFQEKKNSLADPSKQNPNLSENKSTSNTITRKGHYREDSHEKQYLKINEYIKKKDAHLFSTIIDHNSQKQKNVKKNEKSKNQEIPVFSSVLKPEERNCAYYNEKDLIEKSRKQIKSSIKRLYEQHITKSGTSLNDIMHSSREHTPNTLQKGKLQREVKNFRCSTWKLEKHYNPQEIMKIKQNIQQDNDMYKRLQKYREKFLTKK